MNKFFTTHRFASIGTGHRSWHEEGKCAWTHGHGRIVEMTFGANQLNRGGNCISFQIIDQVEEWLKEQWDHRILIAADDPLLSEFKTLHQLGGLNLNIMEFPYGPGVELSCLYVYDKTNEIVKYHTSNRCWVQQVRIWEHDNTSAVHGSFPNH